MTKIPKKLQQSLEMYLEDGASATPRLSQHQDLRSSHTHEEWEQLIDFTFENKHLLSDADQTALHTKACVLQEFMVTNKLKGLRFNEMMHQCTRKKRKLAKACYSATWGIYISAIEVAYALEQHKRLHPNKQIFNTMFTDLFDINSKNQ